MARPPQLRDARSCDAPGIIALITSVYSEFGETMCLESGDKDLLHIDQVYWERGGAFWVLEHEGEIIGTHAAYPIVGKAGVCTFRRLYLKSDFRGTEWGRELMSIAIEWARNNGFARIEFWSDTRFHRAHRFFEKFNFRRTGGLREMRDSVEPYREHFFFLDL